jgi:feruloyl-CoA synthase
MIYVDEADRYAAALQAIGATTTQIAASRGTLPGVRLLPFAALVASSPGPAVGAAFAKVGPDTVAKVLFTSGSTGEPKGVINTQGMLCANQESIAAGWPFLSHRPPVIVDWLPWNHTFGANHNFNMMLRHGGTLYIDEGKPTPALIGRTVASLREVSPTVYFNVPRGYAALLDHLEKDAALRDSFFARLDMLFYAAAALPQGLWDRLERLGRQVRGHKVPFVSSWGLTETSPLVTMVHFPHRPARQHRRAGAWQHRPAGAGGRQAGNPCERAERHAGLLQEPGADSQGLRRAGLAAHRRRCALCRSGRSGAGLAVRRPHGGEFQAVLRHLGQCRHAAHGSDHGGRTGDRGCRRHGPRPRRHRPADLPKFGRIARAVPGRRAEHRPRRLGRSLHGARGASAGLARYNAQAQGSSTRIARCMLLIEPPGIDANEITDKGYINQRAVLTRRAALVERLHADPPAAEVIVIA